MSDSLFGPEALRVHDRIDAETGEQAPDTAVSVCGFNNQATNHESEYTAATQLSPIPRPSASADGRPRCRTTVRSLALMPSIQSASETPIFGLPNRLSACQFGLDMT